MTSFAAMPGTRLITLDDPDQKLGVVGWTHDGAGPRVWPLVIGRAGPLVAGDALMAEEDGRVMDLVTSEIFDDEESWREVMSSSDKYRAGTPLWPARVAMTVSNDAPVAAKSPPLESSLKAPVKTPAKASEPVLVDGVIKLTFGGNLYAKQSFWQVPEVDPKLVFRLANDSQAPDAGCKKITREEYAIIRKTVREVTAADLLAGVLIDEPELPLGQTAAPEDDADDMI